MKLQTPAYQRQIACETGLKRHPSALKGNRMCPQPNTSGRSRHRAGPRLRLRSTRFSSVLSHRILLLPSESFQFRETRAKTG